MPEQFPLHLPRAAKIIVTSGRYKDSKGSIIGKFDGTTYAVTINVAKGSGIRRKELHFTPSQLRLL